MPTVFTREHFECLRILCLLHRMSSRNAYDGKGEKTVWKRYRTLYRISFWNRFLFWVKHHLFGYLLHYYRSKIESKTFFCFQSQKKRKKPVKRSQTQLTHNSMEFDYYYMRRWSRAILWLKLKLTMSMVALWYYWQVRHHYETMKSITHFF